MKLCVLGALLTPLVAAALADCDADDRPPAVAPVVQNFTYNTAYANHFYAPAPPVFAAMPIEAEPRAPVVLEAPPSPPQAALPPLPHAAAISMVTSLAPRDHLPTGVAVCDAYLARMESCTTRILESLPSPDPAVVRRMQTSFDLTRRSWRRAARTDIGRESLVDSCQTSLAMYEDAVRSQCPAGG